MSRARWSCLIYHEVLPPDEAVGVSAYFAVSTTQFAQHLASMRASGVHGDSLESVIDAPGASRVAITFDDGHWSHFTHALPALNAVNMRATFFVITSRVGAPGYCTWEQLREMRDNGMSIQSHTHTHPFLSELGPEDVLRELRASRQELDDRLQQRTTTLALPGGDFPRGWRPGDYRAAGYRWIATSRWGPNRPMPDDALFVRRYTVRRASDVRRVEAMVRGDLPAYSLEGVRLTALNRARRLLGASRYARWRRRALHLLGR